MHIAHQKYAFNKLQQHDKSILLWCRQSGKSRMVAYSIVDYISKNNNKVIFVYGSSYLLLKSVRDEIHLITNGSGKHKEKYSLIGNCEIMYKAWKTYGHTNPILDFHHGVQMTPDFVVFEDVEFYNNFLEFTNSVKPKLFNSKVIITSSNFSENILFADSEGDYYINILESYDVELIDAFNNKRKLKTDMSNVDIIDKYAQSHINKSIKLIDFWNIKRERKLKLEKISNSKA